MRYLKINHSNIDSNISDWIIDNDMSKYTTKYINHLIKKRYHSLVDWFLYYTALYPNCLISRYDLYYELKERMTLTVEQVEKDITRFITNQRCNSLFNGSITSAYCIEQGKKGSNNYHIHVITLWDSRIVESDKLNDHIDKICNYWNENITNGRGFSNNCNQDSEKYKHNCLGECNEEKISNCIKYLLKYLSKDWRPIYKKNGTRIQTLRKGTIGSLRDTIVNRYSNLNLKLKYNLL